MGTQNKFRRAEKPNWYKNNRHLHHATTTAMGWARCPHGLNQIAEKDDVIMGSTQAPQRMPALYVWSWTEQSLEEGQLGDFELA